MFTQDELEKLLGRSLTPVEVTNLELYLEIAEERLEQLICSRVNLIAEERTYDGRAGYSTVFTELFTSVTSVEVDGKALEASEYSIRQWDNRNGYWFNSIVLQHRLRKEAEVVVNGSWGFNSTTMPTDLQLLFAKLFALVSSMNKGNGNVKSKKVEDFTIAFNDNSVYDQFLIDNSTTIRKYSVCNVGYVRSGRTCSNPYWSW